jgi:hypothetical protein
MNSGHPEIFCKVRGWVGSRSVKYLYLFISCFMPLHQYQNFDDQLMKEKADVIIAILFANLKH